VLFNLPGGATSAVSPSEGSCVPPPAHFIPKEVLWARLLTPEEGIPHAGKRPRRTPAQKFGLAYQKRVCGRITDSFSTWSVAHGSWYSYGDGGAARRYCQPDSVLIHAETNVAIVVEIKSRWTTDAWHQLRGLYIPVFTAANPDPSGKRKVFSLCITRSYDPVVRISEEVNLISDLNAPLLLDAFNVLVLR
jgi:hypothetical protein